MKRIILIIYLYIQLTPLFSQQPEPYFNFPRLLDSNSAPYFYASIDIPLITDLEKDGQKEIIAAVWKNTSTTVLYVIKSNGEFLQGFPKVFTYTSSTITDFASGDIDGDGYLEIVIRFEKSLNVIDRFGNNVAGFPVSYDDGTTSRSKFISLYDLDNDGKLELIVNKYGELAVFNFNGQMRAGWPIGLVGFANHNPAIGDIDGDGYGEIVISTLKTNPTDSGMLSIYRHNGLNFSNNWPVHFDSVYRTWPGSPTIFIHPTDLDSTFICVPTARFLGPPNYLNKLRKYNIYAEMKDSFYQVTVAQLGTFAIGDINQDNIVEFSSGSQYYSPERPNTSAYNNSLNILPGWPQQGSGEHHATIMIGKLTNDNLLNITTTIWGTVNELGWIYTYRPEGMQLPISPLRPYGMVMSFSFSDLDNNGSTELIAVSQSGYPMIKNFVHVISFPGIPFTPENFPWSQYAHDRYHTNQYRFIPPDEPIGIEPISSNIPVEFKLYQNYPNPFNPSTIIAFDISERTFVKLKVYDILGREVKTLISETLKSGSYKYDFNASGLSSGVYFYSLSTEDYKASRKMILIK